MCSASEANRPVENDLWFSWWVPQAFRHTSSNLHPFLIASSEWFCQETSFLGYAIVQDDRYTSRWVERSKVLMVPFGAPFHCVWASLFAIPPHRIKFEINTTLTMRFSLLTFLDTVVFKDSATLMESCGKNAPTPSLVEFDIRTFFIC